MRKATQALAAEVRGLVHRQWRQRRKLMNTAKKKGARPLAANLPSPEEVQDLLTRSI